MERLSECGPLGGIDRRVIQIQATRFVAELDDHVARIRTRAIQYRRSLPRYPSVVRDVTLLVQRDVNFGDLVRAIDVKQIQDYVGTKLVGVYEGANIPGDKRAITLRAEYRSNERTLRDEEVEERHRGMIDALIEKFSAVVALK